MNIFIPPKIDAILTLTKIELLLLVQESGQAQGGPGPFGASGKFAKDIEKKVKEDNPEMSIQEVEDKVMKKLEDLKLRYDMLAQREFKKYQTQTGEPVDVDTPGSSNCSTGQQKPAKTAKEYGFARTPNYTWFPATREAKCDRNGRVKVVFLSTGTSATVPLKDWREFSEEASTELLEDKVANRGGFKTALRLLQSRLVEKSGEVSRSTEEECSSTVQLPRKLGPLRSCRLDKERVLNKTIFNSKMYLKENKRWGCHLCPAFNARYKEEARRHSRDCGNRPKVPQPRTVLARKTCSVEGCKEKFSSTVELSKHYKTEHPESVRPLRCPPCSKSFSSFRSLQRHVKEQHPNSQVGQKMYGCGVCQYTSPRKSTLLKHMKLKHGITSSSSTSLPASTTSSSSLSLSPSSSSLHQDPSCSSIPPPSTPGAPSTSSLNVHNLSNSSDDSSDDSSDSNSSDEGSKTQQPKIGSLEYQLEELKSRYTNLSQSEMNKYNNLKTMRKELRKHGFLEKRTGEQPGGKKRKRVCLVEGSRRSNRLNTVMTEVLVENNGEVENSEGMSEFIEGLIEEVLGTAYDSMDDTVEVPVSKEKKCTVCGEVKRDSFNLNTHIASMHTAKELPFSCNKEWCELNFPTLWEMVIHLKSCKWTCLRCGQEIIRNGRIPGHRRKCHGAE